MRPRRRLGLVAAAAAAALLAMAPASATFGPRHDSGTHYFVPRADSGATQQIWNLYRSGNPADARLIQKMVTTPQAVWITSGTPQEVTKQVRATMRAAKATRTVPVLVAYNLPYRDCAQYSAGGATDTAAYQAWIDAFAAGIGDGQAVVLLEPDSLGIIPFYGQFGSSTLEWCQPTVTAADGTQSPAPEADPAHRFAQLNHAVDVLKALPKTAVYLDGTHSGWLGSGDAAQRLSLAGVAKADGFFLNISNYQVDTHLIKYGTWISKCLWFATDPGSRGNGHFDWCGSQYYPATASDFSTWTLTDKWYADNVESQTSVPYPGDAGLKGFVIDSSRNGQGPWVGNEDWCNPPDRGLGVRPTSNTGVPLLDAYLWVKIPGESDGSCTRGTVGPGDPVRRMVDPAAGAWFPEAALELAHNANPPLATGGPRALPKH